MIEIEQVSWQEGNEQVINLTIYADINPISLKLMPMQFSFKGSIYTHKSHESGRHFHFTVIKIQSYIFSEMVICGNTQLTFSKEGEDYDS